MRYKIHGWYIKPADSNIESKFAYSKQEADSILEHFKAISKYPNQINFFEAWIYEESGRTVWQPV